MASGTEGFRGKEAQARGGTGQHGLAEGHSVGSQCGSSCSACCMAQCSGGQSLITALGSSRRAFSLGRGPRSSRKVPAH